jgi:hypothetical protein
MSLLGETKYFDHLTSVVIQASSSESRATTARLAKVVYWRWSQGRGQETERLSESGQQQRKNWRCPIRVHEVAASP